MGSGGPAMLRAVPERPRHEILHPLPGTRRPGRGSAHHRRWVHRLTGPEPWTRTRWRYRGGPPRTGPAAADAVDVLVVDDEESVRSSICEVLETAGMTTAKAADGQEAIELLSRTRFGAMVVDIRMPRLDGLEMLQRLSDPPPTVLVSAYAIDEEVRERLSAKVRDFLQKPFRPAELLQAVSSALGRPL